MTHVALHQQAQSFLKKRPEIRPGFTVRVHERIQEGNKERVQVFEGLVISMHKGHTPMDTTFTVRRIASGVGVEKVFTLHSPKIEKVEVKKVAKVRRAKLFFLRTLRGKAARLQERFTTAAEFLVADDEEKEEEVMEEVVEENADETTEEKVEEEAKEEEANEEKVEEVVEEEEKTEEAEAEVKEEAAEEKKEDA